MLVFKIVHGTQETIPSLAEHVGDRVFVRKNIHRVQVQDPMSEKSVEMWEYEEVYCTVNEYNEWVRENQQSQIDYIAMMTEIDLPEV